MQTVILGFIGAGNMARSLIKGLVQDKFNPQHIWAACPDKLALDKLQHELNINITQHNAEVIAKANVIILAVKPQVISLVCQELKTPIVKQQPLIISIVAGTTLKQLNQALGPTLPIVRTMPNAPALIRSGITGLLANSYVNDDQKNIAQNIMQAVGQILWVDSENQLDAVTALSGSGPAYFLLFMQALKQAGITVGLTEKLALVSKEDWALLQQRVTSPKGTTEQAIKIFNEHHLDDICQQAIKAAYRRAQELANIG